MKKDINIEIGQRVQAARRQAHLSREELAEKLNISTLFMGYIECGQKGMSLTTLKNLCTVLGISADYILLGETDQIPRRNIQILLNTLDEEYLPIVERQLKGIITSIAEIDKTNRRRYELAKRLYGEEEDRRTRDVNDQIETCHHLDR